MAQETRLQQLFDKYLACQCTADEIAELVTLMQKEEAETTLNSQMLEVWEKIKEEQKVYAVDWQQMYHNVVSHGEPVRVGEERKPVKYLFLRVAAAVIALFFLSVGIYYLGYKDVWKQQIPAEQVYQKQDVLPGGKKAMLTLGNGSVINLNDAASGALAKQGSMQVIKLDSGQLAYRAAGRDASSAEVQYNTLTTPRGGQYQLILPDGSKVWLNAASSIRFPTAFTGKKREVKITGEVYFEIAEDARTPFIVKKGNTKIQVLGTHFNVNAYGDEGKMKVTLLEGKVKVTAKKGSSALLRPGEQAILQQEREKLAGSHTAQGIMVKKNVDLDETMAWKKGLFVFHNDGLVAIMRRLQRWYDIQVEYKNGKVTNSHFTGAIRRDVNLSEVLKMLELTGGAHFDIKDKTVIVK